MNGLIGGIKTYPFVRLLIPLIIGIVLSLKINVPDFWIYLIAIVSFIAFTILQFIRSYSLNKYTGIVVNIFLVAVGVIITNTKQEIVENSTLTDYKGFIIGEIYEDPKFNEKTVSAKLEIIAIRDNEDWLSTSGKTLLYIERNEHSENLSVGNQIIFTPSLSEIENSGNPEEFNYKKYLAYNFIENTDYLSAEDWQIIDSSGGRTMQTRALSIRQFLIEKLEETGISNDELAVISALALGYKNDLSDELRHSYSSSGAMHILAVSGLHVGIIYGILVFIFSFIKNRKYAWFKTLIIICFIWFYALLTGLSPSVSRAALMFSIIALSKLQNRNSSSLNAVVVSAFILLLINPYNITNIGFQLSYIAVIGIIMLFEPIYAMLEVKNKFLDKIWSLTAVSIAAQIATAPIAIYYFHQFSNYFLLTNYILIPLSTIAIWVCIAIFLFSWLPFVTNILSEVLVFVIKAMNSSATFIESLPFSVFSDVYINASQLVFLIISVIFIFVFFFSSKRYVHLFYAILGFIGFITIGVLHEYKNKDQQFFIVYNLNNVSAVNIIDRYDNILFTNIDEAQKKNISFSAKNNWLKLGVQTEKYINPNYKKDNILSTLVKKDNDNVFVKHGFVGFNDYKFVIINENYRPLVKELENKIELDCVVLSGNAPINLSDLNNIFSFDKIIIDGSNKNYVVNNWMQQNTEYNFSIHNTKTDGAYVLNL